MTPAGHIEQAELLIRMALETDDPAFTDQRRNLYLSALVHSVIAIAVELGAPHTVSAPVTSSGT